MIVNNCKEAGYKVGDLFICTSTAWPDNDEGFTEGCIVSLYYDDESECPMFKNDVGNTYYLLLHEVEPLK